MFDPDTLDILAFRQLPFVPPPAGTNPALNTTGGAYFYLDRKDRVVSATTERKILVVKEAEKDGQPVFRRVAEYDPRPCLQPDERMPSVLPDYKGRLWFVGRQQGTVGVLDRRDGPLPRRSSSTRRSRTRSRSPATGRTSSPTRRCTSFARGRPQAAHRVVRPYPNDGRMKVGQINAGSGTTPTLMAPGRRAGKRARKATYVAITDNADPLDVVVYRAADRLATGTRRARCAACRCSPRARAPTRTR